MRRTVNISFSPEMHDYVVDQTGHGSVSEYIRSLVRRDRQQHLDYSSRPVISLARAGEASILAEALVQLAKLRSILERTTFYDD